MRDECSGRSLRSERQGAEGAAAYIRPEAVLAPSVARLRSPAPDALFSLTARLSPISSLSPLSLSCSHSPPLLRCFLPLLFSAHSSSILRCLRLRQKRGERESEGLQRTRDARSSGNRRGSANRQLLLQGRRREGRQRGEAGNERNGRRVKDKGKRDGAVRTGKSCVCDPLSPLIRFLRPTTRTVDGTLQERCCNRGEESVWRGRNQTERRRRMAQQH